MKKYFIQTAPFVVPATDGKLIEEHPRCCATTIKRNIHCTYGAPQNELNLSKHRI
jgi:hypothetical protein